MVTGLDAFSLGRFFFTVVTKNHLLTDLLGTGAFAVSPLPALSYQTLIISLLSMLYTYNL